MPDTSPTGADERPRSKQQLLTEEGIEALRNLFGLAATEPLPAGKRPKPTSATYTAKQQRRAEIERRAVMTDSLTWGTPEERVRYWWSQLFKFFAEHAADRPAADENGMRREMNTITAHMAKAMCSAGMMDKVLALKDADLGGRVVAVPFLQRAVRAAAYNEVWEELLSGDLGRLRDALMYNRRARVTLVWNLKHELHGPGGTAVVGGERSVEASGAGIEEDWEAIASGLLVSRRDELRTMKDVHAALRQRGYPHTLQAMYKMRNLCAAAAAAEIYKPRRGNVHCRVRRGHRDRDGRVEAYADGG